MTCHFVVQILFIKEHLINFSFQLMFVTLFLSWNITGTLLLQNGIRYTAIFVNNCTLYINTFGYLEHDVARGILKFQCKTWEFCATSSCRHPDVFT